MGKIIHLFYKKEKEKMKKVLQTCSKVIAKASWQMARANVNSTCRHYVFQDKVPKEVYKLSKNK